MSDGKNFILLTDLTDFSMIYIVQRTIDNSERGIHHQNQSALQGSLRFRKNSNMIQSTFLDFPTLSLKQLFFSILTDDEFPYNCFPMIFWIASVNNTLLDFMNKNVFFPALKNNRIFNNKKVNKLIEKLKESQQYKDIPRTSMIRIDNLYLNFLQRLGFVENKQEKILQGYPMSDRCFVFFLYWLHTMDPETNLLKSNWFPYSLMTKEEFIQRVQQENLSPFYNYTYNGKKLTIEPRIPYTDIYHQLKSYEDEE